jgi:SAM-dependent methyltransferase
MLKMYHNEAHAGSTPDYWEGNWENGEFERAVAFCAVDPLRPLFEKYLRPDSLMLEGGCGMGNYVTYYSARGFRVIGLDFAQRALMTLRKRQPRLTLCGGDVSSLPFADKTFDLYYSGGVVEHFEGGPERSLAEARRVLKGEGILLISVPYQSPLRGVIASLRKDEWRRVERPALDNGTLFNGKKFFQYAYRSDEFEKALLQAGLRTVEKQGYAVIWGLSDLGFRNGDRDHSVRRSVSSSRPEIAAVDVSSIIGDRPGSLVKRLAVREDASIPVLGLGVKMMRWAAANMMMYVCKRA